MYYKPDQKVDDLNPAEDGEASEETHCPPNQPQGCLSCHLLIYVCLVRFTEKL